MEPRNGKNKVIPPKKWSKKPISDTKDEINELENGVRGTKPSMFL